MQIHHVLYKDFGSFAQKEAIVRKIMADDKISEGLICVLSCVEPCMFACRRGYR